MCSHLMSVYVFLTKSWQDFFPKIVSQSNNSQKFKLNGDVTPSHHQVELTVTSVIHFWGEEGGVSNRIVELSNVFFFSGQKLHHGDLSLSFGKAVV